MGPVGDFLEREFSSAQKKQHGNAFFLVGTLFAMNKLIKQIGWIHHSKLLSWWCFVTPKTTYHISHSECHIYYYLIVMVINVGKYTYQSHGSYGSYMGMFMSILTTSKPKWDFFTIFVSWKNWKKAEVLREPRSTYCQPFGHRNTLVPKKNGPPDHQGLPFHHLKQPLKK